jgi:peroxiredoxin
VELAATDGRLVDLSARDAPALVIVYPWTGRPGRPNPPNWDDIEGAHGSTPELEAFRDHAEQFAAIGLALFGLSRQPTDYQRELVERLRLPFPILSDARDTLWPALGLASFETGGEIYLRRVTLLIENASVAARFAVPDPAAHAAELLTRLRGWA